jgi:hypothetical protein
MGSEIGRGLKELHAAADRSLKTLAILDNHLSNGGTTFAKAVSSSANHLKSYILERVKADRWMTTYWPGAGYGPVNPMRRPPFNLLFNNPMFCGLMMNDLKLTMGRVGSDLEYSFGYLMATAHFHNAALQLQLCGQWPDMETANKVYAGRCFVGDTPTVPVDFWRRYSLAFGAAAHSYAPSGNSSRLKYNKGDRHLENPSTLQGILTERQAEVWELRDAYRLVERDDARLQSLRSGSKHRGLQASDLQHGLDALKISAGKSAALQVSKSINLLERLSPLYESERAILQFDIIAMHLRCFNFLRHIAKECSPRLSQHFVFVDYNNDDNCRRIVEVLLQMLAENPARRSPFDVAAAALRGLIEKEGDVETRKMMV